jgi:hypothetical protein
MCPEDHLTEEGFDLIIALFKENNRKKYFYDGRKPTFRDVNLILTKMKNFKRDSGIMRSKEEV